MVILDGFGGVTLVDRDARQRCIQVPPPVHSTWYFVCVATCIIYGILDYLEVKLDLVYGGWMMVLSTCVSDCAPSTAPIPLYMVGIKVIEYQIGPWMCAPTLNPNKIF